MKFSELASNKVHIIGINGIGMSALAIYLKKNSINVTGSDIAHNANTVILEKYKIPVFIGHKSSNIKDRDIIFYSSAIKNNPEIKEAKKNKIPCYNRSKLLQLICKDKFTIVVSGSHGKTSTTSILGHLLVRAGLNPTIISGGIMQNFGQNIYLTDSNYVVVEADESDGTVFKLSPRYLLFLNVDREHIDFYKSYSNFKSKIKNYILSQIKKDVKIFINNDDNFLFSLKKYSKNLKTFGSNKNANYSYKLIKLSDKKSSFQIYKGKKIISKSLTTNLLGEHNVQNLTAVLSIIDDLGYEIKKSHILDFKGTKRRMNILGKLKKTTFIDDYAHHPTELDKLINIISLYKKKIVILIIEPHRYSRLNDLYKEYLHVLRNTNNLIILKTYEAGESYKQGMKNSKNLVNDLNVSNNQKTRYIDNYRDLFNLLDQFVLNKSESIVITAGAGDISNQIRFFYDSRK
ncbi:UDP-N-acetylmuramate--L-alanine ligase [Alphaproteobacteria bacterium]|nr:UDP-N-acetylmuramate--L-alanine ligase [Alphaproteobacteria bacterium]